MLTRFLPRFDGGAWLRVHLGIYGAWDFSGEVSTKLGQTGEYSRLLPARPDGVVHLLGEVSVLSIGAPRRLRMAE